MVSMVCSEEPRRVLALRLRSTSALPRLDPNRQDPKALDISNLEPRSPA